MTTERFCDHCGRHIEKYEPFFEVIGEIHNGAWKYGVDGDEMPDDISVIVCEECGEAFRKQLNARPKLNGDMI